MIRSTTRVTPAGTDTLGQLAAVAKRLTFGPAPGRLDDWADRGVDASTAIDELLAAEPRQPELPELGSNDDYTRLRTWWVEQMLHPDAGVHERMVWFWHTHLTSSLQKAEPGLMLRQHKLLRANALGNLRDLLHDITVDAAMLYWLDGASNTADAPNENYSRELMELFTLGHGADYTEQDVRNGARALAGWWVDDEHGSEVVFDESAKLASALDFLGTTVASADDVADAVCDHPACAPFIAGRVHAQLAGFVPDDARRDELSNVFRDADLEIAPLIEAIVRDPSFIDPGYRRPRSGLEWFLAVNHLYETDIDVYTLEGLGQLPLEPPNVAGWPGDARWISASALFQKAETAWDWAGDLPTLDRDDPVGHVLLRAALFEVSDETRATLEAAAAAAEGRRETSSLLHALVACSPEFSMI